MTTTLKLFLNLNIAQSVLAKRFDNRLSLHSIGLNEFIILFHLNTAPQEKLRRIDLAEKVGMSASGITRMLAPMEKIGLVNKEKSERDARVSFVKLAKGGKRVFEEALETAQLTAEELYPPEAESKMESIMDVLIKLGGSVK